MKDTRARRPPRYDDAHHFRYHIAGAADDHRITVAHVLAMHLIFVVQCRIGDSHATHKYRLQARGRRDRARTAHLHVDGRHDRHGLFGGIFVRERPARRARDVAQLTLLREVIDLVHHAVDVVRQIGAFEREVGVIGETAVDALHHGALGRHAQAPLLQLFQDGAVALGQVAALHHTDPITIHVEWSARRDARIELTQAACRGVARIRNYLFAALLLAPIHFGVAAFGHFLLAAHVEAPRRMCALEAQWHRLYGAHVLRHVLAGVAVAARRRPRRRAVRGRGAGGE